MYLGQLFLLVLDSCKCNTAENTDMRISSAIHAFTIAPCSSAQNEVSAKLTDPIISRQIFSVCQEKILNIKTHQATTPMIQAAAIVLLYLGPARIPWLPITSRFSGLQ
jgi:hypothetical protein